MGPNLETIKSTRSSKGACGHGTRIIIIMPKTTMIIFPTGRRWSVYFSNSGGNETHNLIELLDFQSNVATRRSLLILVFPSEIKLNIIYNIIRKKLYRISKNIFCFC